MHTEEFDYLIRRAAQSFRPSSEAEIEVGWQRLLAVSGGIVYRLGAEGRQPPCYIDLPGPHGQLAACIPRGPADISSAV